MWFVVHTAGAQEYQPDTSGVPIEKSGPAALLSASDSATLLHPVSRADSLVNHAYTFLGKRYRRGGTGARGYDCSGYTLTVFARFGVRLPHTSSGQALMGIPVSRNNLRKGDLVFFRGRGRKGHRIGHVGIVISEKGEPVRFIHSSTSEGVRIDRLEFTYYKKRFVKAIRIREIGN